MEGAGNAIRYGLAGIAVGTATGFVTDKVYQMLLAPNLQVSGNVSRAALTAVAAGSLASLMMFAGAQALEMVVDVGNDPLFMSTYYQSAFFSQSTARISISSLQQVMSSLMPQSAPKPPPSGGSTQPPAGAPTHAAPYTGLGPAHMPAHAAPYTGLGPARMPTQQHSPAVDFTPQHSAMPSCGKGTVCGAIVL